MWKYIDVLDKELFSLGDIDPKIVDVFKAVRSLKFSTL
jgi:hypothetical protein